jgi:TolA-binding protein
MRKNNLTMAFNMISLCVLAGLLFLISEKLVVILKTNQKVVQEHKQVVQEQQDQIKRMQREINLLKEVGPEAEEYLSEEETPKKKPLPSFKNIEKFIKNAKPN